jgi:hypothetical protein
VIYGNISIREQKKLKKSPGKKIHIVKILPFSGRTFFYHRDTEITEKKFLYRKLCVLCASMVKNNFFGDLDDFVTGKVIKVIDKNSPEGRLLSFLDNFLHGHKIFPSGSGFAGLWTGKIFY